MPDGTWLTGGIVLGSLASGNWITPTTTGIGNSYYVRFTRTSTGGDSSGNSTASTTWKLLNTPRLVSAIKADELGGTYYAVYKVEISPDTVNIVYTGTNLTLYCIVT